MSQAHDQTTKRYYILALTGITLFSIVSFIDSRIASSHSVFRTPMILAFVIGTMAGLDRSRDGWIDRFVLLGSVALASAAKYVSLLPAFSRHSAYDSYIATLAVGVMFCIALAGRAKPLFIVIGLMAAEWVGSAETISPAAYSAGISDQPIWTVALWLCAVVAGVVFGYAESVRRITGREAAETQLIDSVDRNI